MSVCSAILSLVSESYSFLHESPSLHVVVNVKIAGFGLLTRVVQKVDNAIHRINHYPADSVVCFVSIYPLDSDLSDK